MMTISPRVTVFMPVYNRADYVGEAVESILGQTWRDFELLIVDDGSSDGTHEVLARFDDPRIRIVRNEKNLGIPATRNLGLELARGELMAMLDSDDVALPHRLERQVRFLDENPDHAVVGSWARKLTADGRLKKTLRRPLTWQRLRARLLFMGTIRTPSAIGRLEVMRRYRFRAEFPVCSDSDYWVQLALDHRCANLPEALIYYRIHKKSITKGRVEQVRDRKMAVSAWQLDRLGVGYQPEDLANHFRLRKRDKEYLDPSFAEWARDWLRRLLEANRRARLYPEPYFTHAVGERWHMLSRWDRELGRGAGIRLLDPELRKATLGYLARRELLALRYGFGLT